MCVCVCSSAREYGRFCPIARACVHGGKHEYLSACTCAREVHACLRRCVCVRVSAPVRPTIQLFVGGCMRACMGVCVPSCVCECGRSCARVFMRACVRACTDMSVCGCAHACVPSVGARWCVHSRAHVCAGGRGIMQVGRLRVGRWVSRPVPARKCVRTLTRASMDAFVRGCGALPCGVVQ